MRDKKYFFLIVLSALTVLSGCAGPQTEQEKRHIEETHDPYESFNRGVFAFNMLVDQAVLTPIAKGYRAVTTTTMREGVSNFYTNMKETRNIANGALQGNGEKTLNATKRFLANTFWGFFGLYNVADDMNVPKYDNDFGQTLAVWGWENSDTYIVLPFFGSSNPRDIGGTIGDFATPPSLLITFASPWVSYPLSAGNYIQMREQSIEFIENLHKSSTDFYATVRSMTQQNRQKVINEALGKQTANSAPDYEFDMDFEDMEE